MDRKYKKNHIALFALLHFGGESAESAESARQKNDSANFYIGGMACRAMDKRRKGGIQSRGTTKKEKPEKEKTEKEKTEKEKPPARIVEQAGVPIDRVIALSRKRILIAHIWSMLS